MFKPFKPEGADGPAVDIVRTGLRFSMAPGDIHPTTGAPVVCYAPDGTEIQLPHVDTWPELPERWVAHFRAFVDKTPSVHVDPAPAGELPDPLPVNVHALLDRDDDDWPCNAEGDGPARHKVAYALVNACYDAGLTQEEATAVGELSEHVWSLAESHRCEPADEVARVWEQLKDDAPPPAWILEHRSPTTIEAYTAAGKPRLFAMARRLGIDVDNVPGAGVPHAAAADVEPTPREGFFTDAVMAEIMTEHVLAGRYVWCQALGGWLGWDGQRWRSRTASTVGEAVRRWVLRRYDVARTAPNAATDDGKRLIDNWYRMLSRGRMGAVMALLPGMVEVDAAAFDAHPDLINTPGGVVNLRTGETGAPQAAMFLTKMTSGAYRPGFTHSDWEQALTALPETERTWLQTRIGQAITGHPTPDGVMPVLQGTGENGKGALTTDGLVPALGDYGDVASPKLIMAMKGRNSEHSTERADLRGQRFVIAEELTEDRALDVAALKQIQDVGRIKARYVHKDNITFSASHSLLATTNYVPVVKETDHGTWRRLALLRFPYTFRKPGEPLERPTDRTGDPALKPRIKANTDGQHDAAVTWAVEGARRWYADPARSLALTETITADTLWWRVQADRILGLWAELLEPAPKEAVLGDELLAAFNCWLGENGHHTWTLETFVRAFEHTPKPPATASPASGRRARKCSTRFPDGWHRRRPASPRSSTLPGGSRNRSRCGSESDSQRNRRPGPREARQRPTHGGGTPGNSGEFRVAAQNRNPPRSSHTREFSDSAATPASPSVSGGSVPSPASEPSRVGEPAKLRSVTAVQCKTWRSCARMGADGCPRDAELCLDREATA